MIDPTEIKMSMDPLGWLERNTEFRTEAQIRTWLEAYVGTLVHWALYSYQEHGDFLTGMLRSYGSSSPEMKGGVIDSLGKYYYPGDPELVPVHRIDSPTEVIFFYQYAMFGICQKVENGNIEKGSLKMHRMN